MDYPYDLFGKEMTEGTVALTPYSMVRDWLQKFNKPLDKEYTKEQGKLSFHCIREEGQEVLEELSEFYDFVPTDEGDPAFAFRIKDDIDKEKLTKELCDLIWVTYQCAAFFGLPIDRAFERVYYSNMSKLGHDGKPVLREDGKILKGPNYKPVDLTDLFPKTYEKVPDIG